MSHPASDPNLHPLYLTSQMFNNYATTNSLPNKHNIHAVGSKTADGSSKHYSTMKQCANTDLNTSYSSSRMTDCFWVFTRASSVGSS